jgi:hypothetical protein
MIAPAAAENSTLAERNAMTPPRALVSRWIEEGGDSALVVQPSIGVADVASCLTTAEAEVRRQDDIACGAGMLKSLFDELQRALRIGEA